MPRMIHPFDLFKIAEDWAPSLKKALGASEPRYVGEPHPSIPRVVGARYKSPLGGESPHNGKLVWAASEDKAREDDAQLDKLLQANLPFDHEEDKDLFKKFVQSVRNDPARHVRKSFDGENTPRARHLLAHITNPKTRSVKVGENDYRFAPEESEVAFADSKTGRQLVFQIRRHKDESEQKTSQEHRVDHFVFNPKRQFGTLAATVNIPHTEKTPTIQKVIPQLKFYAPPEKKVA